MSETREQRLAGIRERAKESFAVWIKARPQGWLSLDMNEFWYYFADSERERVLLEAAKAVCGHCRNGAYESAFGEGNLWIHVKHLSDLKVYCHASLIHDLRSKGESR